MVRRMADPLISVIVPTYGRPQFLAEALASIRAQTYTRWEAIVVDDCSPEPVEVPDWVTLVRHLRNQGLAAARNTGLSHAVGDLVTFLDDDDWFHPDRLQWAAREIGDARTHACLTAEVRADATIPTGRTYQGDLRGSFYTRPLPCIGQCVHSRDDVVQFNPTLRGAEDYEWWSRMGHSAVFASTNEVGHFYRQHDNGRLSQGDGVVERRRQCYQLSRGRLDRTGRALYATKVARAASAVGDRRVAAWWSARAFVLAPNAHAARSTLRRLVG